MKKFQVELNYGPGRKAYLYFLVEETATETQIKDDAARFVYADSIISTAPQCRPTILIKEYREGKVVRGGIKLKTKWR